MTRKTRRDLLAALGASAAVGLAGCGSDGGSTETEGDGGDDESDGMDGGMDTDTDTMDDGMDTDTDTMDDGMGGTANVRVAHFSPDAPNVDVYVDDSETLSDVPFRAISDYLELPAGAHTVTITAAGDADTVAFEGEVTVAADTDYTIAAIGELSSEDSEFRPLVLEDDNSEVGSDTARVRLVHAAPDAPAVDVTAAGGDTVLFDGVPFGESGYVEVPAGTYTLGVRGDTDSNDGDVVAEYTVELTGGTVYTAFAGGYLSPGDEDAEAPFDLTVAVDSGAGGGGLVETGSVRVAHMSPDAPNVDVYVDDSQALSDVPFGVVSDYMSVPSGERTVTITAAGDADTVAFEGPVTVGTGDYTVVAAGELTSEDTEFQPLVLEDDNSDPGGNMARLRVVHGSPDAPAVDVTAAGGTWCCSTASLSVSPATPPSRPTTTPSRSAATPTPTTAISSPTTTCRSTAVPSTPPSPRGISPPTTSPRT